MQTHKVHKFLRNKGHKLEIEMSICVWSWDEMQFIIHFGGSKPVIYIFQISHDYSELKQTFTYPELSTCFSFFSVGIFTFEDWKNKQAKFRICEDGRKSSISSVRIISNNIASMNAKKSYSPSSCEIPNRWKDQGDSSGIDKMDSCMSLQSLTSTHPMLRLFLVIGLVYVHT